MSYNDNADGRQKSDPLKTLHTSPAKAPDWQLSRVASELDADFTKRSDGVNAGGYNALRFAVTPMAADPSKDPAAVQGGTANPSIEVRIWSEQAKAFVPMPGPLARAGAGAGEPYVFDVPNANGSIVGVFVTNDIAGEFVAISAQGHELGGSIPNAVTLEIDTSSPIPVTIPTPVPVTQSAPVLSMFTDMANSLLALAATIAAGNLKVALQTGANAVGKLAANVGVNIGTVDVATLPSLALAAGTNAIGKLAANVGVNIGTVDVASLPSLVLAAGTNAIGKLAANAGINIGTVDVASLPSLVLAAGTNAIGKLAANAGVNIGTVDVASVALPTTVFTGSSVTNAGTRVQLSVGSQPLKEGVDVEAHPGNIGLVYLGGATVGAANGRRLGNGQSVFVRIADLSSIYYDVSISGEGISFVAV
jgi:hypothetical protein